MTATGTSSGWFAGSCLVASCLLWSGNYVLGKLLVGSAGVTPSSLSFWRFLIAGAAMFLVGCRQYGFRKMFALSRRDWFEIAGQGLAGMCAVGLLMFWSEKLTSAINASMLDALIPVAILLGGALAGEKLRAGQIVGIALSLGGCLLVIRVIGPQGIRLTRLEFSDLLIVAAAAAWALYVLWGRGTLKRVASPVYTAWAMLFGMTGTLLYALFDHRLLTMPETPEALGLMAILIAGPTLGAFWTWNIATRSVPLPLLNITQYLIPVAAILFAHWLLREPLNGWQGAGMVLILSGVLLDPTIRELLRRKIAAWRLRRN